MVYYNIETVEVTIINKVDGLEIWFGGAREWHSNAEVFSIQAGGFDKGCCGEESRVTGGDD